MDYKIDNLKDIVYKGFIKGEFGHPKIPTPNEVIKKIESFTDLSYIPLLNKDRIKEFNYPEISGKFSKVIDDIEIIFNSIEDESRDILNQLTSSLKEHNGVKRELRRIRSKTNDIINRKFGEDYLEYNFTESFDDVEFINTVASDVVDTDAGVFTILSSSSNILSLPHYRDRKLDFSIIESFSNVLENGYVGETNATSILSKDDPRSLTYRIKTKSPTKLKTILALQLLPDGKATQINMVGISVDSSLTKGYIRLYYQENFQWKDVPALSIQEIKGDSILFAFPSVSATHIKFEFIKDYPDITTTNEYLITINEIAIMKSSNRSEAKLYSRPIIVDKYSTEVPVIDNITCVMDADIPDGCLAKVYVASDVLLSGQFVDQNNIPVLPDSLEASNFNPLATGTVFLSDIMSRIGISGLDAYRGFDFNWSELKPNKSFGNSVPDIIEFNNSIKHNTIINSLYNVDWKLFGDQSYTGPWPQYPSYGTIVISGWCNSSNPQWIPFLSGAVGSGWFISGVSITGIVPYEEIEDASGIINPLILAHSSYSGQWLGYARGFPLNYFDEEEGRTWKWGDYLSAINGWWRPYSNAILPDGVDPTIGSGEFVDHDQCGTTVPDFYLNGIKFYKIYRFTGDNSVVDSSVKLYSYETRPISFDSDFYNHNFKWKYKSNWSIETGTSIDAKDLIHNSDENFSNYILQLPTLNTVNEEYIVDGIKDIKLHNTNLSFSKNQDYILSYDSLGKFNGILLRPLDTNYPYLKPSEVSFDITYNYRIKNKYLSTWTSYAIVNPNVLGEVVVTNPKLFTASNTTSQQRIVDKIIVEDMDTNTVFEVSDSDGKLVFQLDASSSSVDKHYKITIYCAGDEETGFSARYTSNKDDHFIPSESRELIKVSKGIKFVSRLEPIKIVDISTLIYDTPMSNDKRCALITDYNNERYLVAKIPSKDIFPGYYWDSINKCYLSDSKIFIRNISHFIRQTTIDSQSLYFTTGSSGNIIYDPWGNIDTTWNAGTVLTEYRNTDSTKGYANHSTYGYPITLYDTTEVQWVDTVYSGSIDLRAPNRAYMIIGSPAWSGWISSSIYSDDLDSYENSTTSIKSLDVNALIPNRGYLFYNTGENLPSFYSISYRTVKNIDSSYSRFVYKLELASNSERSVVPRIRSIRFRVNGEV